MLFEGLTMIGSAYPRFAAYDRGVGRGPDEQAVTDLERLEVGVWIRKTVNKILLVADLARAMHQQKIGGQHLFQHRAVAMKLGVVERLGCSTHLPIVRRHLGLDGRYQDERGEPGQRAHINAPFAGAAAPRDRRCRRRFAT